MRSLGVSAAVLVAACGSSTVPPAILGVQPDRATADEPVVLQIQGRFPARVVSDFSEESGGTIDTSYLVRLAPSGGGAPIPLELVSSSEELLTATAPAGMTLGAYDMEVSAPDGASARLDGAYRVVSTDECVDALRVTPLGPQRAGVPFVVVASAVDARGRRVQGFEAEVVVKDSQGTLVSPGAHMGGGLVAAVVTLPAAVAGEQLTLEDGQGHSGQSAPFDVLRGYPVSLGLAEGPRSAEAGACSEAFEVELRDGLGKPAETSPGSRLSLASIPRTASFYSDDACGTPVQELTFDPVTSAARFHVRDRSAGAVELLLTPTEAPTLSVALSVKPGEARSLAFTSEPRRPRAGECSAPLELAALDEHSNPSMPPARLAVTLSAEPPVGVGFFADAACSQRLGDLALEGRSGAVFHVRGASPGEFTVRATPPPGATVAGTSQVQRVMP